MFQHIQLEIIKKDATLKCQCKKCANFRSWQTLKSFKDFVESCFPDVFNAQTSTHTVSSLLMLSEAFHQDYCSSVWFNQVNHQLVEDVPPPHPENLFWLDAAESEHTDCAPLRSSCCFLQLWNHQYLCQFHRRNRRGDMFCVISGSFFFYPTHHAPYIILIIIDFLFFLQKATWPFCWWRLPVVSVSWWILPGQVFSWTLIRQLVQLLH